MEKNRRKDKRYSAHWKVAMVFGASEKRPIFHTLTHDLSVNGTAVQYSTNEKVNTVLTLLLIPPAIDGIDQKVIKLKAVVMSSHAFRNGFRLGFSFVHDAELEKLWGTLKRLDLSGDTLPSDLKVGAIPGNAPAAPKPAAAPAGATAAAPAVPPAPTAPVAPAPAHPLSQTSVLELIKQRNLDKKKADEQAVANKDEEQRLFYRRISDLLMTAHKYLHDLVTNLNELKPPYAGTYTQMNVPDIKDLSWQEGARADCGARASVTGVKVFNEVGVIYTLGNPAPVSVTRDPLAAEKTEQALKEIGIAYREERVKNAQGGNSGTTFIVPREIRVRLTFTCDDATGKLFLETRNLERFGAMRYEFAQDGLNEALLDQIALMMLGERNTVSRLIKRVL